MQYTFTKMHGAGNDYIYMDGFHGNPLPPDIAAAAVEWSRRRFSVGSDGIILILPHDTCDAEMRIFNADGSEGKMCGNGIRCVAKYLYDNGICRKKTMRIMTKSGERIVEVRTDESDTVRSAIVGMGVPCFVPSEIPLMADSADDLPLVLPTGESLTVSCVSVGNPHAVCFVEDVDRLELERIGPMCEKHPFFPEQVNTEFVQVLNSTTLKFRVWERGSGETLACGTGISAACAVAVRKGICPADTPITVHARGGTLVITVTKNGITMEGPAEISYRGVVEYHGED